MSVVLGEGHVAAGVEDGLELLDDVHRRGRDGEHLEGPDPVGPRDLPGGVLDVVELVGRRVQRRLARVRRLGLVVAPPVAPMPQYPP